MSSPPVDYVLNDGAYWDRYVRQWEQDPGTRDLWCVGREWGGEEVFVEVVRRLARPEDVALEIGCGGGRVTAQVHDAFRQVVACDVSQGMLARSRQLLAGRNVSFHVLDGFTLQPLEDQAVDFIYSHDVFVHFSSLQVYSYLREMWRCLVPGGKAVLSFYDFHKHFGLFRDMSLGYQEQRTLPPHMRVHFLTEDMLRRMLQDVGFTALEIDKQNFLVAAFQRPARSVRS